MMSGLGVFIGLTPMCFSSELKGYLAAKRVMEIIFNLEDKVVLKGWVLIETKYGNNEKEVMIVIRRIVRIYE
jgi:hypothetical protein